MTVKRWSQKGFTLIELIVVMAILSVLIVSGLGSFMNSQKRSRDLRRKNDLRQISVALESYYNDMNGYPVASGGLMLGCGVGAVEICGWGDAWKNTSVTPETVYMQQLPEEVQGGKKYYYVSDGTFFKLYALLENTEDTDTGVKQDGYAGTDCGGSTLCTYGISSANATP